ncbi:MAG: sugar phosphate isomerase/epimerase [Candidatus Nealsonbacteria bacterium]|nr:sugar phosphate isomerase/epimerase [Candidatus Nealsonbacteria bacterium]
MDRRTFLKRGLATSVPAVLLGSSGSAAPNDADKMNRIGCTTVAFRSRFPSTRADKTAQPDDLTPLDVPRMFAAKLGVHNVELWSRHFPESSPAYCRKVKTAAERAGSQVVNIQMDEPGYNLSDPDAAGRKNSIALVKQWMDRAAACGATSLRANTGGGAKFDVNLTGDAFGELAEHGKKIDVKILLENHGGYSSDPDNLVAIIKHVDDPFCRALPDFGNMPGNFTPEQRIEFLGKLFPYAHFVSAKGMVFDAKYAHQSYDVAACVQLGEKAGFKGVYSVELWAANYSPPDPARAVNEMIRTITENI